MTADAPPGRRRAALATLIGTGSTVAINLAQAFLLIPIALTTLGPGLYGAWLGASEWLIWLQLLDMGIPNLLTQRIGAAVGTRDSRLAARWMSAGMSMVAVIGCVLGVLAWIAAPWVTGWAGVLPADAAAFTRSFRAGVLASAVLLMTNGVIGASRGLQATGVMAATQVTGAVVGLVLSALLLVAGYGIWSLGLGLLGRAAVAAGGSAWFLLRSPAVAGLGRLELSAAPFRETATLAPAMAAGSIGYVLANNTDLLLITTVFGPVGAAAYALTRRAIDGVRSLLDAIAWAVYGAFAHLVTAADRHRSHGVLADILGTRFFIACVAAAVAVAVNRLFVTLLFGAENYGGLVLTVLFAVQMIVSGQAFLANYLLRAAGHVREGSYLLAFEALVRVAAMALGILLFGAWGAPLAAILTSGILLVWMLNRLGTLLPPAREGGGRSPAAVWLPIALVAIGVFAGYTSDVVSWGRLVVTAAAMLAGSVILVLIIRPPSVMRVAEQWRR